MIRDDTFTQSGRECWDSCNIQEVFYYLSVGDHIKKIRSIIYEVIEKFLINDKGIHKLSYLSHPEKDKTIKLLNKIKNFLTTISEIEKNRCKNYLIKFRKKLDLTTFQSINKLNFNYLLDELIFICLSDSILPFKVFHIISRLHYAFAESVSNVTYVTVNKFITKLIKEKISYQEFLAGYIVQNFCSVTPESEIKKQKSDISKLENLILKSSNQKCDEFYDYYTLIQVQSDLKAHLLFLSLDFFNQ